MNNPLRHLFFSLFLSFLLSSNVSAAKYQQWFWWYVRDGTFPHVAQDVCKKEYDGYMTSLTTPNTRFEGFAAYEWCVCVRRCPLTCYHGADHMQYFVEDCILDNIRSSYQMNYQAAAVVLGVLPGLLSSLGARLSEISYLSVHRPVLSFLLALGSPAVWPTRLLEFDDPVGTVKEGLNKLVMPSWRERPGLSALLSALQYLLALASVANMFEISWQLGKKSVLAWSCTFDYGPLFWAILPVVIHFVAAIPYGIEIRKQRLKFKQLIETNRSSKAENQISPRVNRSRTLDQAIIAPLALSWLATETTLCANQEKGLAGLLREQKTSNFAIFFNCFASLLAFGGSPEDGLVSFEDVLNQACTIVHLIFGTILFASLLVGTPYVTD